MVVDLTGQVKLEQFQPVGNGGFCYIYRAQWQNGNKIVEVCTMPKCRIVPSPIPSIGRCQSSTSRGQC
jgi:hypothetical protein